MVINPFYWEVELEWLEGQAWLEGKNALLVGSG